MCGIAGILGPQAVPQELERLSRSLTRSLQHRGPDDRGWLLYSRDGGVRLGRGQASAPHAEAALLHWRLSILDLSPAGWQPMSTPDGRYHIVFNGEIYNYLQI